MAGGVDEDGIAAVRPAPLSNGESRDEADLRVSVGVGGAKSTRRALKSFRRPTGVAPGERVYGCRRRLSSLGVVGVVVLGVENCAMPPGVQECPFPPLLVTDA